MAGEGTERRPRARRLVRALALAVVLPIFLVVLFAVAAPLIITGERVRATLVSALTDALGVEVRIDRLEYRPLSGVDVEGIVVGPPAGFSEDMVRVERIRARWSLDDVAAGRIAISELAVVHPILVLETRAGSTNLDAILSRFEGGPPEPEETHEPGPLLPIDLAVDGIELSPIELRLAGDGPNVQVEGLSIGLDGTAGRESIDLSLAIALDPEQGRENVRAVVDAEGGERLAVSAPVSVDLSLAIEGKSSRGLALETAVLAAAVEAKLAAARGAMVLPPLDVALSIDASVSPAEDRATIGPIAVELFGAEALRGRVEIDGLFDALEDLAGAPVARALGIGVGLLDRNRGGAIRAELPRAAVDLDRLMPWIAPFVTDLDLEGHVGLEAVAVAGTARQIAEGTPSELGGSIVLEDAGVRSGPLSVERTSGRLTAARDGGRYGLAGVVGAGPIANEGLAIGRATLRADLGAERVRYPATGETTARIDLSIPSVKMDALRVEQASIVASLRGGDPLSEDRAPAPIVLGLHVEVAALRAGVSGSTAAISQAERAASRGRAESGGPALPVRDPMVFVTSPRVAIEATLDRLIAPSRSPIAVTIDAAVPSLALPADRAVGGLGVAVVAELADPRLGAFDATIDLTVSSRSADVDAVHLEKSTVAAKVRLDDVAAREAPSFPGGAPPMLPAASTLELVIDAPSIALRDRGAGALETGLRLETSARLVPASGEITIDRGEVRLRDVVRLAFGGRVGNAYQPSPSFDVTAKLDPVDLGKLLSEVPRSLLDRASDLEAQGTIGVRARLAGKVPGSFTGTTLVRPPIGGRIHVDVSGVGASSKAMAFGVSGFSGRIEAELGEGRVATETTLDVDRITYGAPPLETKIDRLSVRNRVGHGEEAWIASSNIRAGSVVTPFGADTVEGASLAFDATYPQRGDFTVDRLEVQAPGNGVVLSVSGALARKTFGVLRPSLDLAARIDLDRLKHLLPQLSGGSGRVNATLAIASKGERTVDVAGKVELDRFSFEVPGAFAMVGATGRIPMEQRFLLPAPEPDEAVALAEGLLGDDLVARIAELSGHFEAARFLVDSTDILVEAPRAADYQAMRPYMAATGASMTIDGIAVGRHALEDVILEGLFESGVLRVDRFACKLWEGDLLGDLAVQMTADRNVELRMRGTMTDLNVDVPYAVAKGIEPVTDPSQKEDFRVSGQMDVELSLRQRTVDARVDLVKLGLPLVRRIFGALLVEESPAVQALDTAQYAGVRPTGGRIWISNNLANVALDWEQLWLHVSLDQPTIAGKIVDVLLFLPRPLLVPTLGGWVVNTVNGAVRDMSISALIEAWIPSSIERWLELHFAERLIAEGEAVEDRRATR